MTDLVGLHYIFAVNPYLNVSLGNTMYDSALYYVFDKSSVVTHLWGRQLQKLKHSIKYQILNTEIGNGYRKATHTVIKYNT